jgi:rod shape-determining protein MreD
VRYLAFAVLITLCFILESRAEIFGIRPNLTVLIAYYVGLRHGPGKGMAFGAALGIIADSLSGGMLGPNLLGKGTAGYLASFLTGRLFTWTPFLGFLAVAVLTSADGLVSFLSTSVFAYQPTGALSIVLLQAAVNSLGGLFLRPRREG